MATDEQLWDLAQMVVDSLLTEEQAMRIVWKAAIHCPQLTHEEVVKYPYA